MPGSFNNQLKTNNILLDEHKIAKLSDYGVSAIIEENEKLEVCSISSFSVYLHSLFSSLVQSQDSVFFLLVHFADKVRTPQQVKVCVLYPLL